MKKRLFAVLMMLVMLIAAMVITAQAATVPENVQWIELGSKEDFLEWFDGTTASKHLTDNYTAGMTRYYKLTADITVNVNSTVYYLSDTAAQVNTYFDLNGKTLTYASPASAAAGFFKANNANTTQTFVNGNVVNNSTADFPGALFLMSAGNLVMEDVVITDNARSMTYTQKGKMIYSATGGSVTLTNVDITVGLNTATNYGYGLAVYSENGNLTMTGCNLVYAGTASVNRGALVYKSAGITNITNCTFAGGYATYGGNFFIQDGNCTITGCTFTAGNCLTSSQGVNLRIANNTGKKNTAVITGCTFNGGTGTASVGGNVYSAYNTSTTYKNCTFIGGKAANGGSIYAMDATTTFENCKISGGTATGEGGNVIAKNNTVYFVNTDVSGGTATTGGNISASNKAVIYVKGGTISGGKATNGGNISAYISATITPGPTLYLESGTITGGVATTEGGNIYAAILNANHKGVPTVNISGGTVTDGKANIGGNISVRGVSGVTAKMTMTGGTIGGTPAQGKTYAGEAKEGGNLFATYATVAISGGEISNGYASSIGGNVYPSTAATATVSGTAVVSGGKAGTRGGNFYMSSTNTVLNIQGGTVQNGTSGTTGGNIDVNNGKLNITGGIITKGNAGSSGGNIYAALGYGASAGACGHVSIRDDGNAATPVPQITDGTAKYYGGNIYIACDGNASNPTIGVNKLILGNAIISGGDARENVGDDLYINKMSYVSVLPEFAQRCVVYFHADLLPAELVGGTLDSKYVSCDGVYTGQLLLENDANRYLIKTQESDTTLYISAESGHIAGEAVIENKTDATCTVNGSYDTVIYCTQCGAETSRVTTTVSAFGHTAEVIPGKQPTCNDTGLTAGEKCSVCGVVTKEQEEIPAAGHSYSTVVTDPTCTAEGYTTYTCTACGDSYVADKVDAAGHSYSTVVTEPTCTAEGYTTYTCTACGDSYVADKVAAAGHSYSTVVTDPTCTAEGYTTYTCTACGDSYVADKVEATGHNYEGVKTEATFENDAFTTYTCTVCGHSYVETEEGTKLVAVATADGVPFETLQEALTAGGNVVLLQDIADSDALEVKNTVILDLNGKTVSMNDASGKAAQLIKNSGDLTIVDSVGNGKLTFHSTTPSTSNSYSTSTIINIGALKILSGTIENTTTAGPSYAIDNAWYTTDVSLSVEGGVVTAQKVAIRQVPFSTTAKNTITISGGELSGYAGLQIHNYQKTACLSDVTITGGTLTGSYAFYTSYSYNNTATGTNIAIDGGEFNGYVYLYNGKAGSSEYPMTVSVTGGTFNTGYYAYCTDSTGAVVAIPSVTGGTHIYDVTDYCAEGYGMHANDDGTYGIHQHTYNDVYTEATFEADAFTTYTCVTCGDFYVETEEGTKLTAVATADSVPFETLQEALNAGGEVVLLQDITMTEKLVVNGTASLDLNGHTLTLADLGYSYSLVVSDTLKIVGNGTIVAPGGFGIGVGATGNLTIENGTYIAGQYNDYLVGNYGVTVINNGTFEGVYNCVNNFAGVTKIYGGTYTTAATDYTGEYESADLFADAGLTVYGGTYSKPVEAAYCAETLCPKDNGDGTYTVTVKGAIVTQPADVTVEEQQNAQFTVEASGDGLRYKWQYTRNGSDWYNTYMDGCNSEVLTVPATVARNGYQYRCIVTDAYGNEVTSETATLTVNALPVEELKIVSQPTAQTAVAGNIAQFTVEATGEGLTYQWQYSKNGTNWYATSMEGYDTATLNVVVTAKRDGYQYRCVIKDSYGAKIVTEAAALVVTEKQITTSGPEDQVAENGKAVFTVEVEGEGLKYRWQYNRPDSSKWFDTTMDGYATSQLTVTATARRNGYKYRCVVTDAYGNETISEEAVLTVE